MLTAENNLEAVEVPKKDGSDQETTRQTQLPKGWPYSCNKGNTSFPNFSLSSLQGGS